MRENCYKCMRPKVGCMCQYLSPIDSNTKFVILIHPMEYKKEKNGTGILTYLQLKNSELIMGVDFTHDKKVNALINNPENECFILYPGEGSLNLSREDGHFPESKKQKVIFIIDGTWPCAKKMLKLSRNLHTLAKISFDPTVRSDFILKQQPNEQCLSTIESTKVLLELLNKKEIESLNLTNFLGPFNQLIKYQINCIENPPANSYRTKGKGIIKRKDMYKTPNGRKLFFDENEFKKHKFLNLKTE